jgi:hypothetical protein
MASGMRVGIAEVSHWLSRDNWLSRKTIITISGSLLVLQLLGFGILVAGSYGLVKRYGPDTVSFVSFYAAGQLANIGDAPLAYNEALLYRSEEDVTHPGVRLLIFPYPPVYLLLCALLARLPFVPALALFEATTLILYLMVVRRILGTGGWSWFLPALAFPATFWTIGYGQNGFLTAALLGAGTLQIDRRPAVSGALFGMLCYKPQFALLIPVALVTGRRWTSIAGAVVTVGLLTGLSIALFGWETWQAYLRYVLASGGLSNLEIEYTNVFASVSPSAAVRLLGLSDEDAWLVQLAAISFSVLLVAWVWGTHASLPIRSAALAAGTLFAAPHALLYDLMLAAIAMAWLVRVGCATRIEPWEKLTLAVIYVLPLFAFQAGLLLHLPFAPLAGFALVLVCATRAWRERGLSRRPNFDASKGNN